jgi:hypothetical protein
MFTIDEEATSYFRGKIADNQAVRVFFGGYG